VWEPVRYCEDSKRWEAQGAAQR